MPTIMRQMNVIARCSSAYKAEKLGESELCGNHHPIIHAVCRNEGISQEAIAKTTFLNKSTVARSLAYLEEHGFVKREADPEDKRALRVYPTDKLRALYPKVRALAGEWNEELSRDIPAEELEIFSSVLARMYERAVKATSNLNRTGLEI